MFKTKFFIHNIEAGDYLEALFLSAIVTILSIRLYLHLAHYPQIGGHGFHIAHMLWGGLFMLTSIVFLLAYLNKTTVMLGAIIGGIGFGTFIDELGKFITKDNNYFFQPTTALMYVIFVLIFLLFRFLEKNTVYTYEDYLANAFRNTVEALFNNNLDDKIQALELLKKCNNANPVVQNLTAILNTISLAPSSKQSVFEKIQIWFKNYYQKLIKQGWFIQSVMVFFVVYSLYNLYKSSSAISYYFQLQTHPFSYIAFGKLFSSFLSAVLIVIGIFSIQHSRLRAYRMFRYAVLVSVFLTEFFNFYQNQFEALVSLVINLFVLIILQYVIQQENNGQFLNNYLQKKYNSPLTTRSA